MARKKLTKGIGRSNPNLGYVPDLKVIPQQPMPRIDDGDDGSVDGEEQISYTSYTSTGSSPLIDFPAPRDMSENERLVPSFPQGEQDPRDLLFNNSSWSQEEKSDGWIPEPIREEPDVPKRRLSTDSNAYNSNRRLGALGSSTYLNDDDKDDDDVSNTKFVVAMIAIAIIVFGIVMSEIHSQVSRSGGKGPITAVGSTIVIPHTNPDELQSKCDAQAIMNGEFNECENACAPAKCCWDIFHSCYKENKVACEDYRTCLNLELTGKDIKTTKSEISQTCNDDIFSSLTKRRGCHNLCEHKMCCFPNQSSSDAQSKSCRNSVRDVCEAFQPCKILMNPIVHDPLPPAPLNPYPLPSGMGADNPSLPSGSLSGGDGGKYSLDVDVLADLMEDACDDDIFHSQEKLDICQTLCKSRLCCFLGGESDCSDSHPQECIAFKACEVLMS